MHQHQHGACFVALIAHMRLCAIGQFNKLRRRTGIFGAELGKCFVKAHDRHNDHNKRQHNEKADSLKNPLHQFVSPSQIALLT